ncbi:hypothetical protein TeGR_g9780 [Tetraparma gracilis]|uniref:CoA transferase n=1 Tax=Tetraparma gracilis TaxID=2962635 RepID=A0ABQ6N3L9_9STRA|nr:hypothetical protein TeGR_g9780 [Tetraparma gracilis]
MSLTGVKILDLTRVLAGPYCTQLLADLGASVIKVESHAGDDTRRWGPPFTSSGMSTYFSCVNRSKRSICLDLKSPAALPVLTSLVNSSDVLVHNFLPSTASKLSLDYESITKLNPKIIHANVTGYGDTGPLKNKGGYDVICSGMYGLMDITGSPTDATGTKAGVAITDLMTGLMTAQAITAKLYERDANSDPSAPFDGRISTSLMDTQLSMLANVASSTLNSDVPRIPRYGNAHESIVPYQTFVCSDGKSLVIACGNDKHYQNLASLLDPDCTSTLSSESFSTNQKRVENRTTLLPLLENLFRTKTQREWSHVFENATLPWGPVRSVQESFDCEQALARDSVVSLRSPEGDDVKVVAHPAKHSGVTDPSSWTHPPSLGADTRAILEELGTPDVQALFDTSVVR